MFFKYHNDSFRKFPLFESSSDLQEIIIRYLNEVEDIFHLLPAKTTTTPTASTTTTVTSTTTTQAISTRYYTSVHFKGYM